LGADYELIQEVKTRGIEGWLDEQVSQPPGKMEPLVQEYQTLFPEEYIDLQYIFDWSWWQQLMTSPDLLRQRVAFALSEIFVISRRVGFINDDTRGVANYYDLLITHAFGNFRDLLLDVTLHPVMGAYLSHLGNRKADLTQNRYPDENYAREVMQLFTIGLFELNQDGTQKLDENGDPIPTYTNKDITEFAKIFTGLTIEPHPRFLAELAEEGEEFVFDEEYFLEPYGILYKPMIVFESEHEPGPKRLLNGTVVPAGQGTLADIEAAVDNLFNHPNVGPFIGLRLIQRLVKSNPSPAYVSRVAAAFNDNGAGVRGDMEAVIRAILMDEEARDTSYMNDPTHGMLREPLVRYISLCRTFNAANQSGEYTFAPDHLSEEMLQYVVFAPSVFNFFLPNYQPIGPLADADLVAPEFQITTAYTTVSVANLLDAAIFEEAMWIETKDAMIQEVQEVIAEEMATEMAEDEAIEAEDVARGKLLVAINQEDDPEEPDSCVCGDHDDVDEEGEEESQYEDPAALNLEAEIELAETDVDAMIDRLDLLLTYGTLTPETHEIIRNAVEPLDEPVERVKMALSLLVLSPEYTILK